MSFSTEWLDLREPADRAARDAHLLGRLSGWTGGRTLRAVDLGCGAGSTCRALETAVHRARWTLADNDPALLAEAARRTGAKTVRADISGDLHGLLKGSELVTASALLDLVGHDWIEGFVAALPWTAAVYAPLNYDGRESWRPAPPHEEEALAAFHAHQRGDKGLGGPALGPGAAPALAERLKGAGWEVTLAPSPWRLGPGQAPLIAALARGAAEAVGETGALDEGAMAEWAAARAAARHVIIGHVDLLALPPGEPPMAEE